MYQAHASGPKRGLSTPDGAAGETLGGCVALRPMPMPMGDAVPAADADAVPVAAAVPDAVAVADAVPVASADAEVSVRNERKTEESNPTPRRVRTAFEAGRRPPAFAFQTPRCATGRGGCRVGRFAARDHAEADRRERRHPLPSSRSVLELTVPVRVVAHECAPALRHPLPELEGDAERLRQLSRLRRSGPELHASLLRSPSALSLVAGHAGRDDVLPGRLAAERARDDVVVGDLVAPHAGAAVLAPAAVPRVDVLARELQRLPRAAERAEQPHDRRHLEDERDRPDLTVVVLLDDLDLAEEKERHGALPGDTSDGLVPGIQNQRFHGSCLLSARAQAGFVLGAGFEPARLVDARLSTWRVSLWFRHPSAVLSAGVEPARSSSEHGVLSPARLPKWSKGSMRYRARE